MWYFSPSPPTLAQSVTASLIQTHSAAIRTNPIPSGRGTTSGLALYPQLAQQLGSSAGINLL
ncbi:MAG: hypothetical protein JRN15_14920, partial [Nitrososphaerota archaeon]|nr:hypothetical protein [Nitrososphaerota archaeon]